MAGGKLTPRQKMINLMYLVFIAMLALNMSKEVLSAFGLMTEKFESSNKASLESNKSLLETINQKGSENAGEFGAAKKAAYEDVQRAFYTGYKKFHGIKVEAIHLPNGMSFLFGPVSARHNDAGLLQMPNIDNYLAAIQDGKFTVATPDGQRSVTYSVLGDSAFNFGLQCVQSYFFPLGGA